MDFLVVILFSACFNQSFIALLTSFSVALAVAKTESENTLFNLKKEIECKITHYLLHVSSVLMVEMPSYCFLIQRNYRMKPPHYFALIVMTT